MLAVNVLAPYLLTALSTARRLIYLSSGMHTSGRAPRRPRLDERRWDGTQAYCDSKLLVTTLAAAVARHWPDVRSNAVDPGWVPTRMGGPHATDDLDLGHDTQVWLATSDEPAAATTGYWYHRQPAPPQQPCTTPTSKTKSCTYWATSPDTSLQLPRSAEAGPNAIQAS